MTSEPKEHQLTPEEKESSLYEEIYNIRNRVLMKTLFPEGRPANIPLFDQRDKTFYEEEIIFFRDKKRDLHVGMLKSGEWTVQDSLVLPNNGEIPDHLIMDVGFILHPVLRDLWDEQVRLWNYDDPHEEKQFVEQTNKKIEEEFYKYKIDIMQLFINQLRNFEDKDETIEIV